MCLIQPYLFVRVNIVCSGKYNNITGCSYSTVVHVLDAVSVAQVTMDNSGGGNCVILTGHDNGYI